MISQEQELNNTILIIVNLPAVSALVAVLIRRQFPELTRAM